jgi:transposase
VFIVSRIVDASFFASHHQSCVLSETEMPCKKRLHRLQQAYHPDLKKRVVYQVYTLGMSTTEVSISLNMPLHVIQRILQNWRTIEEVCRDRSGQGRAPLMRGDAIKVCLQLFIFLSLCSTSVYKFLLFLLEQNPDIYLDEIQDQLDEQHGLHILLATIWRTIKWLGIASKKVFMAFSCQTCL